MSYQSPKIRKIAYKINKKSWNSDQWSAAITSEKKNKRSTSYIIKITAKESAWMSYLNWPINRAYTAHSKKRILFKRFLEPLNWEKSTLLISPCLVIINKTNPKTGGCK